MAGVSSQDRARSWRRRGLVVVVLSLALMGCGGSSSSSAKSAAATAAVDPRSASQLAADQDAAKAGLLTLADMPSGWQSAPRDESSNGPDFSTELAACLKVDSTLYAKGPAQARSDTFSKSDAEVEASVTIQPTLEKAKAAFAPLAGGSARACFESTSQKVVAYNLLHPAKGQELPDGVAIKKITVGTLSFPPVGEESAAYRVTIAVSSKGFNVELLLDFVYVRVGRATGQLSFQDVLTPFDDSLAQKLAAKFTAKLPAS